MDSAPRWLFDLIVGLLGLIIVGVIVAWLHEVRSQGKTHGETADDEP